MKKLIIFDLDGTLAESKSAVDPEMAALLRSLLDVVKVAVISGGDWPQFEIQLLSRVACGARLNNLLLLPTCGTKFYRYGAGWERLYSEDFTREWGEQIEDRGSQITFSALGQRAPLDAKRNWDPDFAKRKAMKALLDALIPEFSVHFGGATSIDVTRPGVDKAYGIRKLRDTLGIAIDEMIFVGDALFPGGNDYPAVEAGAASIQVRDPDESKRVIEAVVACLR